MFKSRNIDAIGRKQVNLKKVSGAEQGRVAVRTSSDYVPPRRTTVPEDYRTLDHGRRGGWGFIIFLCILFAATVAGLYYWNNRPVQFQGDSVSMEVTAEEDLISGNEINYVIAYQNQDVVALTNTQLDVQWPEGFYFNEASEKPSSDAATTWVLGPLDPGQKKQLRIKGQLVGTKGQTQSAIFRLSYRPENINSDFEIKKVVDVRISDSQLDVVLTASDKVIAGQEVEFKAEIRNVTTEKLTGLDVELILPKDFDAVSVDPKLDNGHWKGDLPTDKPLAITVKAKVASDADGSQVWIINVNQTTSDQSRKLLHKELAVTLVKPDLDIDLKINGQSGDFTAEYGQALNYQLKIINKGSSAIGDVKVTALMDSDVIDRKTVQTTGITDQDTIVWTKTNQEELGNLEPGAEVIISWKATLLEAGSQGRATIDNVITLEIEGLSGWRKNSAVMVVTIGEGLVFNQGLYWNLGGEQVGSGNLPPVTNEKSVYLVVWSLDSGSQDFDTVNISSFLPGKVTFVATSEVDEGTLKYDPDTNRLEWQINNFSSKLLPLKATFTVKLVPRDEDKGTVMTVLNPASVVASGVKVFQSKSFGVTTAQVITTVQGDVGTIIE